MSYSSRHATISEQGNHEAGCGHRPSRCWWAPWRSRCVCGLDGWPCRYVAVATTSTKRAVQTAERASEEFVAPRPSWDGPTVPLTPLLTRAQLWRGNGGAK